MTAKKPPEPLFGQALANVKRDYVRWLWDGRIPIGSITLLDGDGGLGKSTLMLDIAARVSTGAEMPDGTNDQAKPAGVVLILSGEDALEEVIAPRLDGAQADPAQFWVIHGEPLKIPRDLRAVEAAIRKVKAKLVVIDPLMDFIEGDLSRNKATRDALRPLSLLAAKTDTSIVGVRNVTKTGLTVSASGLGSASVRNLARSQLIVTPDPDDGDRSVLAVGKSNVANRVETLGYEIVEFDLPHRTEPVTKLVWLGQRPFMASDLVKMTRGLDPLKRYQIDLAMELIEDMLTVADPRTGRSRTEPNGDPVRRPAKMIQNVAKNQGLGGSTVWRAFRALDGITEPGEGGPGVGGWWWRLP